MVKKLDAIKIYEITESGNTDGGGLATLGSVSYASLSLRWNWNQKS